MDLEFNESAKIKAKIYGSTVELSRPTVGMIEALEEQRSVMGNDKDKMVLMKSFLKTLGMPEDLTAKMEIEHYTQLIEFLMAPKKK